MKAELTTFLKASYREWSFYLYPAIMGIVILLSYFNFDFFSNPETTDEGGWELLLIFPFVFLLLVAYIVPAYRLRRTFTSNYSESMGAFFWGMLTHSIKLLVVVIPFIILGFLLGLEEEKNPLIDHSVEMGIVFLLNLVFLPGYALVVSQLHAKYSLRGSFKVLRARFRFVLGASVALIAFTYFPYFLPGGGAKIEPQGLALLDDIFIRFLGILDGAPPVFALVVAMAYHLVSYSITMVTLLYVAKSLMGTELLRQRTAKEIMA